MNTQNRYAQSWNISMEKNDSSCPRHFEEIEMDLCQDYQMLGSAEFVPRMLEDELEERWIRQCMACDAIKANRRDPFAQPEMNLE